MIKYIYGLLVPACFLILVSGSLQSAHAQPADLFSQFRSQSAPSDDAAPSPSDNGSALPNAGTSVRSPGLQLSTTPSAPQSSAAKSYTNKVQAVRKTESEIREEAFNAAITGILPLNPNEIRNLLQRFDEVRQAVEVPVYPYPTPDVAIQTVSLDPGVMPPVIYVGTGHVATLNIVDITSAPWPIQDISWAGDFEVIQPEEGGHVVRITAMKEFAYGNVSIRLLELDTPITFTLKVARDKVHYRFDARIPEYGPYAKAPLVEGKLDIAAGDSILGVILDGVPPANAEKLTVSGVDARTTAYLYKSTTYVRTPLTLLSPPWSASVASADGMHVYAMSKSPVVLLSERGKVVRAMLKEKEDFLDE